MCIFRYNIYSRQFQKFLTSNFFKYFIFFFFENLQAKFQILSINVFNVREICFMILEISLYKRLQSYHLFDIRFINISI